MRYWFRVMILIPSTSLFIMAFLIIINDLVIPKTGNGGDGISLLLIIIFWGIVIGFPLGEYIASSLSKLDVEEQHNSTKLLKFLIVFIMAIIMLGVINALKWYLM